MNNLGARAEASTTSTAPSVLGLVCSPSSGGRTVVSARSVLDGARSEGAHVTVIELAVQHDPDSVQNALAEADGVVIASPTYRARSTSALKVVLEGTPRGMYGEERAPLLGKAVAIVQTGASAHHFLALDDQRGILAGFFCAQVLSPGRYLEHSDFTVDGTLTEGAEEVARLHGRALVELTTAIRDKPALRGLRPQM